MAAITLYDPTTGAIAGVVEYPSVEHIEGRWDSDAFYVVKGKPVARPALQPVANRRIAADDVEAVEVSGIPAKTAFAVVFMDAPAHTPARDIAAGTVEDGVLAFSSAVPGRYQITLDPPFPWRPMQFEVNVAHR